MFTSARLKLTAWYLLIIMCISLAFSLFIYEVLSLEINRFARVQRFRIERPFFEGDILTPPTIDIELVAETQHRIISNLVVVNGTILAVSAVLGYFLAGRTLDPIKKMLDDQNRFISDSSHELRTPLTALKSSLEVNLRDQNLRLKDARQLISESLEEVNKLQSLSDGLLRLAQYEKPQPQTVFETVSLDQIIADAVRKVAPLARIKNIAVVNKVKNIEIIGNKYSLTDLFVILLDNAIKYSPENKKIYLTADPGSKTTAVFVRDQGIGIAAADLPHIFERFYRSDHSRTNSSVSGFGLGLSIAKKIAENHHAVMTVTSSPGQGSIFQITFRNQS